MIPFILAAVGGYLIGDSMKSKKFADGGGVGNIKSYRYNFDNYIKIEGTNYGGKLKLGYAVRNVGGRTETYPYLAEIQWDDNNVPNNSDEIETFVDKNLDNLLNAPSMMSDGGMTDFGYHNINKEVTLKNGEKVFITKGRYYWSNELGDARPSGVYYMTKDQDLISDSEISFPLEMAKGGMTEHGLKSGDKIIDTVYYDENTISVMNDGKYAAVDLDKGERIEGIYANGGITNEEYNVTINYPSENQKSGWASFDHIDIKVTATSRDLAKTKALKEFKKLHPNKNGTVGNVNNMKPSDFDLLFNQKMADGGEIEKAARFRADNPNWTNEKILAEYNDYKYKLREFNAGNIKPSKVIGGGYKSSAIARKLAKKWLEDRLAENKMALEIRGVMADGGITIWGNKAELPLSNHQMKNYVIDKTGISSGTYINGKYYDSWDKIATDLGFIKDENGWVKAFPSRIYTKKMARGGESHSDQMIDIMNRDREQEMGRRRMKFQETTLEEDMQEAKDIFGKYWDTLTEKEKIEATKYLKIKGEVGHFGREDDDVQTFMNDLNYKRGGRTNE